MNRNPITNSAKKKWDDDPIRSIAEDRLNRAPWAKQAAELIARNHNPESSIVYGISGPWGSGKSSIITLISFYLLEVQKNNRWKVVTFTPWATSSTESLFSEFFAALSTVLPPEKKGDSTQSDYLILGYRQPLTIINTVPR
ncbi:P-loop NTPase fold protein [Corynebacterium pygosceleis]|uniref:P-loop NTPase fold protein n=1 Tax=Corynebacterium pygosceleis TaxID=2800406 RepID=UPI0019033673|nr:P-loop NTPase fold protein [Corynebacterium pygosceleis]